MHTLRKIIDIEALKESINKYMDLIQEIDPGYSFMYKLDVDYITIKCWYNGSVLYHRYDTIDCINSYLLATYRILKLSK